MRGQTCVACLGLLWAAVAWLPVRAEGEGSGSVGSGSAGTKAGEIRSDNGLEMELIWCPPGDLTMGSPLSEPGRDPDEAPVPVKLTRGFWLGQKEVTQSEWVRVMGTQPWQGQLYVREEATIPATWVSWTEALEFARRLTADEQKAGRLPAGWEYTLPTEAQWEWGCRAGTTTAYAFGESPETLGEAAWFVGNAWDRDEKYPHPVGQKRANAWGLHDLHGNVEEWCLDNYRKSRPGGADPLVTTTVTADRVIRGGTWCDRASSCRTAYRVCRRAGSRSFCLGFRVVLGEVSPKVPANLPVGRGEK